MSVELLKQAMERMASEESSLPNDGDKSTVGVNNVYPNPEGRESGNIDAPWGEKPDPRVQPHGSGVESEAADVRKGVLGRVLDGIPQASAADRGLIGRMFRTPASQRHESHSVLLGGGNEKRSSASLSERVLELTGRR